MGWPMDWTKLGALENGQKFQQWQQQHSGAFKQADRREFRKSSPDQLDNVRK